MKSLRKRTHAVLWALLNAGAGEVQVLGCTVQFGREGFVVKVPDGDEVLTTDPIPTIKETTRWLMELNEEAKT